MSLKHIRTERKMTQEKLAKILGISQQAVANWESGSAKPRADMLLKIAGVFGCTVDELLKDDGERAEG